MDPARETQDEVKTRLGGVAVVNGQPIIATPDRSAALIDGEEVSITLEGDDMIVIRKEAEVIETVERSIASSVAEPLSVDVNREAAHVILDG